MRICRVATVPFFLLHHLGGQIRSEVGAGHEVVMVASPGNEAEPVRCLTGAAFEAIPIARRISPVADLLSLVRLFLFFRRRKFDLVHSTTPKAGLLTAIAGRLAGVPIRLHTFTGQAWSERRGPVRWLGKLADAVIARLNQRCYADSFSQREFIVAQGVAPAEAIGVLGQGSLAGVDIERFNPQARLAGATVRKDLGIPPMATVVGFVGRITRDKGVVELLEACRIITASHSDVYVIFVGPDESSGDAEFGAMLEAAGSYVRYVGYQPNPERWMAAFDLFCLPSYREGFGNVVLEAAAMGIPSVGTRIPGLVDAIEDEVTGVLVPVKNFVALANALIRIIEDSGLRDRLGREACNRAVSLYDARIVNARLLAEYQKLAEQAKRE